MSETSQPRLLSFALDGWPVLGNRVHLDLESKVGVLVGRNGAGKSAVLEGLSAIASFAASGYNVSARNRSGPLSIPTILDIAVQTPQKRILNYQYELLFDTPGESDSADEWVISWNDKCQYMDDGEEVIWMTDSGLTTFSAMSVGSLLDIETVLGNTHSFSQLRRSKRRENTPQPIEMRWVYQVLRGIRMIGRLEGVRPLRRRESLVRLSGSGPLKGQSLHTIGRIDRLSQRFLQHFKLGDIGIEELSQICSRIGIGENLSQRDYILQRESVGKNGQDTKSNEDFEFISEVLLDGVNLGNLSDGTIRILSILLEIIDSPRSATTIIEEPEIQIHPGMLSNLLRELDAYTFDENLLLSTHSPQVVSWTKPENIHLIHREHNKTSVRRLEKDEIENVVEYLCEEGDLGEWLYGGILDE